MNPKRNFAILCLVAFSMLLGAGCYTCAQTVYYERPTTYSNSTFFSPCGGENFVENTTSMATVYTGKTGEGPVMSSATELTVTGSSSSVSGEGNQTSTSFSGFPAVSGTLSSLTINYALFSNLAQCAYLQVTATTTTGTYNSGVISILGGSCTYPGCSLTLPANTIVSTITVNICAQATYDVYGSGENFGQEIIYDLWADYSY
jgi:hypothetical protein